MVRDQDQRFDNPSSKFRYGGRLDLEEATATLDALVYALAEPTQVTWDATSVSFDSIHISRAGEDPMHMVASGVLAREGRSDFRLDQLDHLLMPLGPVFLKTSEVA